MAHEHDVIDKDLHFVVDPKTMVIACAGTVKALKRGDHRAERFAFEMPRFIEGHDMALCNKVEVHYNNLHYDKETRETTTNRSFDEVEDFGISATSEDTVVWSWLIQGDATQLDGTLNFCFRFACMNGDEITYQKFTDTFSGVPIGESIWNTEAVAKEYADVLEAWRNEILGSGGVLDERVAQAVADYFQKNPKLTIGFVELLANKWVGSESPYSQVVTIPGTTPYSQIDLTPSVEQLAIFHDKDLAFVAENDDGVVTVYAIGDRPQNDYTMQVTIKEVSV